MLLPKLMELEGGISTEILTKIKNQYFKGENKITTENRHGFVKVKTI